MHSNGGMLTVKTAARLPVRTCLSGPAAGVVGAAAIASSAGYNNILAFDVGGTMPMFLDFRWPAVVYIRTKSG